MSKQYTPPLFEKQNNEEINIKDLIARYLQNWQWMAMSVFICLIVAFCFLNCSTPQYKSTAKVLIKEDNSGGLSSNMEIFEDLGLSSGSVNLENEIELFKSLTLLKKVSDNLNLSVKVNIKDEIYQSTQQIPIAFGKEPISLKSSTNDSLLHHKEVDWSLTIEEGNTFLLTDEEDDVELGTFVFGTPFSSPIGSVILHKTNTYIPEYEGRTFSVQLTSLQNQALFLQEEITIKAVNDDASVLKISLQGPDTDENNAIISTLIHLHEQNVVDDKREITKTTSDFINDRMKVINEELSIVEVEGQNYKTAKNITDLRSDAQLFIELNKELEGEITQVSIELELSEYMTAYLKEQSGYEVLLPTNLGFKDASIASNIAQYNTKVLGRNRLLEFSNENNPLISALKEELAGIKVSLSASLKNLSSTLEIKLTKLELEAKQNQSKIASIPEYEREYRSIARQQQIKENLYLYLLQKREENEIAMAATLGNTIIIDEPYSSGIPVSPNKKIILLGALLLGLLKPISIIYIKDLLDNKIRTIKDLESLNLPFAGDIPVNKTKEELVVDPAQRSAISEAFRMLRTNINFLLHEESKDGSVVAVTSSVKGEGKTFITYNLAVSIGLTNKKVIVVGMDLRSPKLTKLLNVDSSKDGITNYLINHQMTHQEITHQSEDHKNLSYIFSGPIPPNPSELLYSTRLKQLIDSLRKEYDYILIDTAPIGVVTDTQLIVPHVDLTLFVTRANYSDKRLMEIPKQLHENSKVSNIALILNDVKDQNKRNYYGYGYGYGYGYDFEESNKSFLSRFRRKNSNQ